MFPIHALVLVIPDGLAQAGLGGNLSYINYLARASIRGVDCLDRTAEGIRLIVNKAQQVRATAY